MFLYLQLQITDSTKERQKMIVSVNSMNSEKISCCLLRVRQENRCALCMKTLFHRIEDMILTDTIKQHQTEIEGKLELMLGSKLRKECVTKKSEEDKTSIATYINVYKR